MKNLKRLSLILALVIAVSSMLCIGVFAHEHTEEAYPPAPVFDTELALQELLITVPEMYQYYPNTEEDNYYVFAHGNESGDIVIIELQDNKSIPNGITALKEEEIKNLFLLNFLAEGDTELASFYKMNYDEFELETINGVKMYKLRGTYAWEDDITPADEIQTYGFCGYMTATKENIYFIISLYGVKGTDDAIELMEDMIPTAYINGTLLDGSKLTKAVDFSSYRPYAQAVKEDAADFYENYYENYGDEFYEDVPLNEEEREEYKKIVRIVCIVLIVISLVPTIVVSVVAIILIAKYSKNKKKLKELEDKAAPAITYNASQTGTPYNL